MFLFGVNFNIYYLLLMRRGKYILCDDELRMYVGVALISIILIAIDIRSLYPSLGDTVRHSAFQCPR